jgi:multidrug efflux pump subunit AcrA (membrane-fusion protein)
MIDEPIPGLRPGMTAEVEILVYQAENVISVPVQAVVTFDGKDHVAVKKPDGGFDWREVTLGPGSDKLGVEVQQGLQSGDVVILEPVNLMSETEKREKLARPPIRTERAKQKAAAKAKRSVGASIKSDDRPGV